MPADENSWPTNPLSSQKQILHYYSKTALKTQVNNNFQTLVEEMKKFLLECPALFEALISMKRAISTADKLQLYTNAFFLLITNIQDQ